MTLADVYGTRPESLPKSLVRLVRRDQPDGRRLTWVGRPGVQLLDLDQHNQYERESIGRYPRKSDGAIDWDAVTDDLILGSVDADSNELGSVIQQFTPKANNLICFWESLAAPSADLEIECFVSSLLDITESVPEFWIYSPSDQVVVEVAFFGTLTAARVPTAGG